MSQLINVIHSSGFVISVTLYVLVFDTHNLSDRQECDGERTFMKFCAYIDLRFQLFYLKDPYV